MSHIDYAVLHILNIELLLEDKICIIKASSNLVCDTIVRVYYQKDMID